MYRNGLRAGLLGTLGVMLVSIAPADAAPLIFFGEDANANGSFVPGGNAVQARQDFLSNLSGIGTEDFEGFSTGDDPPLALNFPGSAGTIGATITGDGEIFDTPFSGRFATSGITLYEVMGDFGLTFSDPIAAFGFFGTDIGDVDGQLILTLTKAGGGTVDVIVPNTINGSNGSLLFYGFVDPTESYSAIAFDNTASGNDAFGFDDMTIGDLQQVTVPTGVPEPGSLALLGAGLAGLGLLVRRRKAA